MTDRADEIARETWAAMEYGEPCEVIAAALRSYADDILDEARSALQAIIDRCGNDPVFADRSIGLEAAVAAIVSLKSKEPQP